MRARYPAFIVPFYRYRAADASYLRQTVLSLRKQSDPCWEAVIVIDGSPMHTEAAELRSLVFNDPRFKVVYNYENLGSGLSRNAGIRKAAKLGAPFLMFLDSDDLAHPDRVAVTKAAFVNHAVTWAYSPFTVIDEDGRVVEPSRLTPSVVEILEWLDKAPPCGRGHDVLRQIGLKTGYITLTSGVSVRTSLAVQEPFPAEAVSEDTHTWFRYAASATEVAFLPTVPVQYRIPQAHGAGSSVRDRVGEAFYPEKARVDLAGFAAAVDLAVRRGTLDPAERWPMLSAFSKRLAFTMRRERQEVVARSLTSLAAIFDRAGGSGRRGPSASGALVATF